VEDLRQQIEALRAEKDVLQSLVKHPGWALLVSNIAKQAKGRGRECGLKPTISIEDALRRNVQLGVIFGLRLAVGMPTVVIGEKQAEFETLLEEIRRATEYDSNA
jgi:hypothetical protein